MRLIYPCSKAISIEKKVEIIFEKKHGILLSEDFESDMENTLEMQKESWKTY